MYERRAGRASQQPGTPDSGKLTREGNHLPTPISTSPRGRRPRGRPDTRSGGSVLEAPPGAEEGALPRKREPVQPLKQLAHGSHSPASVVRYALSQTLAHGSLTPPQAASGMPSLSNPYRVTGTLENSRTVPSGSPERTSASPMSTASAPAPA